MDTQIPQDLPIPPPSDPAGTDPDLDSLVYGGQIVGQKQADAALRGYELRRLVMERMGAKKEMAGWIKRHTGTIEECRSRLENDPGLTPWQRMDLEGRMEIARARRWTCQENIRQYDLEISVYLAMLR